MEMQMVEDMPRAHTSVLLTSEIDQPVFVRSSFLLNQLSGLEQEVMHLSDILESAADVHAEAQVQEAVEVQTGGHDKQDDRQQQNEAFEPTFAFQFVQRKQKENINRELLECEYLQGPERILGKYDAGNDEQTREQERSRREQRLECGRGTGDPLR